MKTLLTTLVLSSTISIGFSQNNPCQGVTPEFTTQVLPPAGGVQFTNASVFSGNQATAYNWDFGNGEVSDQQNPFALYEEGTFQVTLTVTDLNGCESSISKSVTFSYGGQ